MRRDEALSEQLGVPIAVEDGRLRLREHPDGPTCHGFQNGCGCDDCEERERDPLPPPEQPWVPRASRHAAARREAA